MISRRQWRKSCKFYWTFYQNFLVNLILQSAQKLGGRMDISIVYQLELPNMGFQLVVFVTWGSNWWYSQFSCDGINYDFLGAFVLQSERSMKYRMACKDYGHVLFLLSISMCVFSKNLNTPIGAPWLKKPLNHRYK